jgi:chaperone BCS1
MAANFIDVNEHSSYVLEGDKSSSKMKPWGGFVMTIEGKKVLVSTEDDGPLGKKYFIVKIPRSILERFVEVFDEYYKLSGELDVGIYKWCGWSWRRVSAVPENREAILPRGVFEGLVADAALFLKSKDWFEEKGIPWRRGYLLHGIPGTGKTSTAICFARSLNKSLYCLNSKNCSSASTLEDAMNSLPKGVVVLIEDIDCIFDSASTNRDPDAKPNSNVASSEGEEDEDGISLSDFLNAIDGATSHTNGRILVITTNHLNELDAALVRPGRIDVKIEFTHAESSELERISIKMLGLKAGKAFFKKNFARLKVPVTMAKAENLLLPEAMRLLK